MKNRLCLLALLISINSFAQLDTISLSSEISDVTVFFNGAEVTRTGSSTLSKGKHTLLVDELPNTLNEQSIQVQGFEKATILSVKSQQSFYNSTDKSDEIIRMEDKIKALQIDIRKLQNTIEVYDIEETFLLENSKLAGKEKTVAISELKVAAEFYQSKLLSIRNKMIDLELSIENKEEEIKEQYKLINQAISKKKQVYIQLYITVEVSQNSLETFQVSYYIPNAGWTPNYDFRVKNIDSPLKIVYNSKVYQSSGEKWDKVNITLSSNNPTLSGEKPELRKWVIGKTNTYANLPYSNADAMSAIGARGSIKGTILGGFAVEPVPFANVTLLQRGQQILGTTTDFDGKYTLKPIPPGRYDVLVSYVGFQPKKVVGVLVSSDKITRLDVTLGRGIDMNEVSVVGFTKPLFERDQTSVGNTTTREEIEKMAVRSVADIAQTAGNGVFSRDDGAGTYNVRSSRNLPKSMIEEVHVQTGGTPSSYNYSDSRYSNFGSTPSASANRTKSSYGDKQARLPSNINEISSMVNLAKNSLSLEYKIKIPYTIPSDGNEYNLKIKETAVKAEYEYFIVPKIDKDAFLVANVIDWEQLNLLSGPTSLYYRGTFIGESYVDANQAEDTLSISLGRDKSVFVSRELSKELAEKQFSGNTIKETVAWDLIVKNTKNTTIKVNVEDQYPISEYKSVEVDLLSAEEAKNVEKTGKLSWTFTLDPSAKKEFGFKYFIKYPKYSRFDIR